MINFYEYHNGRLNNCDRYLASIERISRNLYALDEVECKPIINIIKKVPHFAYRYAQDCIGGRWLEAEPYIITEPFYAYMYAKHIMKSRWIEAELCLKDDKIWGQFYNRAFEL